MADSTTENGGKMIKAISDAGYQEQTHILGNFLNVIAQESVISNCVRLLPRLKVSSCVSCWEESMEAKHDRRG